MAGPSEGLARLLATFDRMEISYLIGGSVASSTHGPPRTTMDVDLVADLKPDQIEEFVEALRGDFYADEEMIREALARGRSFNLIHHASAYKFDVFPLSQDAYSRVSFDRRRFTEVRALGNEPIECAVASAEDTMLRKLEWYRAGGETSERQWNDLRGVLRVSGSILDYDYLRHWAKSLKVDDLLEELLGEE
jgi:hypothetical protein